MEMLTFNQINEKIRDHLIKQNARSVNTTDGATFCAYRGNNGTMCAVGCLIGDSLYESQIEHLGVSSVTNIERYKEASDLKNRIHQLVFILTKSGVDTTNPEIMAALDDWQCYHDTEFKEFLEGDSKAISPDQMFEDVKKHYSGETHGH